MEHRAIHGNTFGGDARIHQGDVIHHHGADTSPQNDSQCLADLRTTDPRDDKKRIEDIKGGLLKDSYQWILDHPEFRRWRHDEHSRLLWIKGDPGKGKTMLLCGILDELRPTTRLAAQEANTLLSYFFCQAADKRINSATAVLRGLLYLLVEQQPSLVSQIQKKYKHAGKTLFEDHNAWAALSEIFTCILEDPSLKSVYFVIDALDECETDLPRLLQLVVRSTTSSRVKWIVSSRNRHDIERQLKPNDSQARLSLELKENAKHVSHAVDVYIEKKISELEYLEDEDDDALRDQIRHALHQKAHGTFLWVSLVVDELKQVESWNAEQVLEEVPTGLDELYHRMMRQIEQLKTTQDREFCRLVLSAATLAYRPLSIPELSVVAGLRGTNAGKAKAVQTIVRMCGSFLTLQDDQVFVIHQSANDYLTTWLQPAGVTQGHIDISRRSLDAMTSILEQKNPYNLGFSCRPKDMSPPQRDPLAPIRYSCVFWVDHLCSLNSDNSMFPGELTDDGKVFGFLKECFLRWLESLSLIGELSSGLLSIRKILHAAQSQPSINPCLLELLRDAEKFAFSHGSIIEQAPLQTYGSALVFSPILSEIRNQYWKERLSFIEMAAGIGDHWGAHRQTLEGHSGSVTAVAFSPDGRMLASASDDRTVRLWDIATGTYRQTLSGHSDYVTAVAFSPDGRMLALASDDRTVRLWDIATGTYRQTLEGHSDCVTAVAFSPDGRMLASASGDRTVRLWDIATGTYRQTLEGHSDYVTAVAFSPDGSMLASASDDRTVRLWDIATGMYRQTLEGHSDCITAVVFSPDSSILASASDDRTVRLWDIATGIDRQTLEGHSGWVTAVAFSPDGRMLASASSDRTVRLWDTATGIDRQTLKGHSGWVRAVAFSPDSSILASASADGTVRLWDTATGIYQMLEGHGGPVRVVAFSPDGRTLASASDDRTVRLWDTATGTYRQTLDGYSGWVRVVAFSPDGSMLASASNDGTVWLWGIATGTDRTLEGHGSSVRAVVFSLDGSMLASASDDGTVRLWDTATGIYRTLEGHSGWVTAVAFSPDGSMLASASNDGTVWLWDIATGTDRTLDGHSDWVTAVAFSPDGSILASASVDRTVRLWDTATGIYRTLEGHSGWVTAVAFSPDGSTLASASVDGTVRLWDTATCTHRQTLVGDGGSVRAVAFSRNGQCLETDRGLLSITVNSDASTTSGGHQPASSFLFVRDNWVMRDGRSVLWLPVDYRPTCVAVHGPTLVLGHASGRVTFFQFAFTE